VSHHRMDRFYGAVRGFLNMLFRAFLGMRVRGRHWFPREGRVIVAVNHVSGYDPFVVGSAAPRELHYLAKIELFRNPLLARLLRRINAIPLRRGQTDRGAIDAAFEVLEKDRPLLLFPEGTRSRNGRLQSGKRGVGMLAWKSQADVLPGYLSGTFRMFPHLLRRRITVTFGKPILIERFRSMKVPMRDLYRRISDETMNRIRELRDGRHD
jgi:1-acyl-sn-glycerol-3-phosphate acyltransferase